MLSDSRSAFARIPEKMRANAALLHPGSGHLTSEPYLLVRGDEVVPSGQQPDAQRDQQPRRKQARHDEYILPNGMARELGTVRRKKGAVEPDLGAGQHGKSSGLACHGSLPGYGPQTPIRPLAAEDGRQPAPALVEGGMHLGLFRRPQTCTRRADGSSVHPVPPSRDPILGGVKRDNRGEATRHPCSRRCDDRRLWDDPCDARGVQSPHRPERPADRGACPDSRSRSRDRRYRRKLLLPMITPTAASDERGSQGPS